MSAIARNVRWSLIPSKQIGLTNVNGNVNWSMSKSIIKTSASASASTPSLSVSAVSASSASVVSASSSLATIRSFSSPSSSPSSAPQDVVSDFEGNKSVSRLTEENTPNLYGSHDHHFEDAQLKPEDANRRTFVYLLLGTGRFIAASAVRVAIIKFISYLSASADVLAMSSVEVDISNIQPGSSFTAKWRGKPVFLRHRTEEEINLAKSVALTELKDPQEDSARVQDPQWLVVIGVCTHLGCVPIGNAGDYKGWFCPCHGSHYDTSGRIRKGPAPFNLEIPSYKFLSPTKILLG